MSRADLIAAIKKSYGGNEEETRQGFEALCILLDQYDSDFKMADALIAELKSDLARVKEILKEKIIRGGPEQ